MSRAAKTVLTAVLASFVTLCVLMAVLGLVGAVGARLALEVMAAAVPSYILLGGLAVSGAQDFS